MICKLLYAGLMSLAIAAPAMAADFTLSPTIKAHAAAKAKPTFIISYHDPALSVAVPMRKGVELAAKELNVDAQFTGPVGGGAEKQVAELENWITKGVDGIAVSSSSTDALAPVINKALAAGIPVVTFNTDNPASSRLTFVGQDLVYSGVVMGDTLVKAMGDKGKILVFTVDAAAQWSKDRENGVRQALAKHPGITIASLVNTTNEPQQIYAAIENAVLANPDITGIISLDCCSFPAIGQYLERNGLSGKIPVVGSDLLPQTRELIQSGALTATITQNPQRQGHDSVLVLDQIYAQGKMPPAHTDTGVEVIDKSNVEQHEAE
ncbi:sugar ABC transporter substrate-binding protein [Labrys monachus]|uniref:Simple sugar transport system substrate-binding protein/ribose transport system substrate-binding protein n=1 Tax=Labrys monachus TaxID=217067 RepID=A0ABU0FEP6_9HYPH|nr:sugar ABC transporter substrate-binding protein [Labrys monachus]MDQ0393088.1 simple sugar transport system substrate-binding protein/ribose transport system substrate-binding protein [Labrys monachus]